MWDIRRVYEGVGVDLIWLQESPVITQRKAGGDSREKKNSLSYMWAQEASGIQTTLQMTWLRSNNKKYGAEDLMSKDIATERKFTLCKAEDYVDHQHIRGISRLAECRSADFQNINTNFSVGLCSTVHYIEVERVFLKCFHLLMLIKSPILEIRPAGDYDYLDF